MTYQHETGKLKVPDNENLTALDNPSTGWTAVHLSSSEPLFPHEPKIEDIQQAQMGDCFLLASLAAIVSRSWGPEWILGMMRDLGTGRVAIRLHDAGTACYYTVEKSIVYTAKKGTTLHSTGPLWVQIVEKAFTAYAKGGTVPSSYAQLNLGGEGKETLKVLLGQSDWIEIPILADRGAATFLSLLSLNSQSNEESLAFFKKALPKSYHHIVMVNEQQPGTVVFEWMDWIKTHAINTVRFEDVERFLNARANCYGKPAKGEILEWLDTQPILPGKRGTGRYSDVQLDLYAVIRSRLASGQIVTASTRPEVGKVDFYGHSASEPVSKGLAGRHEYAVISCRRDTNTSLRWITLRNPWGVHGRTYQPSTKHHGALSATSTTSATFEIELSDLTKRFHCVYYGKSL